jgi:hypothetical protein
MSGKKVIRSIQKHQNILPEDLQWNLIET